MLPSRVLSLALVTLVLPSLGACGDSTSPVDLGALDPVEVTAAVNSLINPFQASNEAVTNLGAALLDLQDAGIEFARVAHDLPTPDLLYHRPVATRFTSSIPPMAVEFPPEVLGQTFAYDPATMRWEADPGRAGAPANGVRVIWYELDGTGGVIVPLVEKGHIDMEPGEDGALDPLMMRVVETRSGGDLTLLEFVQGYAATENGVETESFEARGSYSDGAVAVDFDITSVQSVMLDSGDSEYSLVITIDDGETRYDLVAEGVVDGASEVYEDTVTATVARSAGTTVLEVVFQGTGNVQDEASGTLVHDGDLAADIAIAGNTYEFTTPEGERFPASQSGDLNRLFRTLTLGGLLLMDSLPLFFLL